jgi:poly-gamma-glutamate capsule biosynthesis protein CapA/YwtB (metallophosphatase superfamily)
MLLLPVANVEVETCLREILIRDGYSLNPQRSHGETGVDIVATRNGERYHIEAIGYKVSGPARAKDFYESFFRIVSRLNDGATHCVLALSQRAKVGLPARAKQHRVAWLRIADAFPELEIWLVDTQSRSYTRTTWREWAEPN